MVAAHFQKFPDPTRVREIKRVDVIGRVDIADPDAAADADAAPIQFIQRKFTVENTAPRVIKAFGLPDPVYFLEDTALDPNRRVMRTRGRNLSFGRLGECTEETVFADAEGEGAGTSLTQYGACVCHRCGPLKAIVERYANRFVRDGAQDGVQAFRDYLARTAAAVAAKQQQQQQQQQQAKGDG